MYIYVGVVVFTYIYLFIRGLHGANAYPTQVQDAYQLLEELRDPTVYHSSVEVRSGRASNSLELHGPPIITI